MSKRMKTADAATYLGLSGRTLEAKRVTGGGPKFLKLGRAVRYDVDDLDAWLAGCVRTSTCDPG